MSEERKKLLSEINQMFSRDTDRNIFKNFIEYIRFPFFKNFEKDLKVNFTYPITFIAGLNGSGKSSLLHALYGSPKGKSVADYWFTTDLDPIKDLKGDRNCLIYSFKTPVTKRQVEVLKQRSGEKKGVDYWEPAEPKISYNMEKLPDDADLSEASKDRWNQLDKNVYLMDFRYSISAYDRYFYFGNRPKTRTLKSKQDIIRKYAPKLRNAFDGQKPDFCNKRKVFNVSDLPPQEKECIERIIGKKYEKTQFAEHDFYDRNKGFAIRYKTGDIAYSEAYAGSGETAVVKLIHDLINAEDFSLILLDEPETSLHPSAQKELMNFILKQIKIKKLQVVVSTHSPDIICGMPKESIKVIYEKKDNGKVGVLEDIYPENAFVHIGHTLSSKKKIIVEDRLAQMIVEKVLEKKDDKELFEVRFFPGGASQIKQNEMTVYSKEDNCKNYIFFDGDQNCGKIDVTSLSERDKTIENLNQKIIDISKGSEIKFSLDGNATADQKKELMLKYIKYHNENVFFLPKNEPEEIIWSDATLEKADIANLEKVRIRNETDFKRRFNLFANLNFGDSTSEYQIKAYEYFLTRWLKDDENEDYSKITRLIDSIKQRG